MKKTLPIILLSVFTFAFSAFGFLGIQPVKASTTVGTVTVEDTDVNYEGASLTYAEQDTTGSVTTSGNGKMKFYSSITKTLYESLTQATDVEFKTGTLIIPAELLTGEDVAKKYESLTVLTQNAIDVDTTNCWVLYDKDEDGVDENNDYWAMASLYSIPRAYYGVPMAARPYLAIKVAGDADYTYFYASADGITDFYSLATTSLAKLKAGDYDDKEELKTAITNDYTKFTVTFHFAPLSELNQKQSWASRYVETWEKTYTYGSTLGRISTVLGGTHMATAYCEGTYRQFKGFYNKDKTAFVVMVGLQTTTDEVSTAVGGSGSYTANDKHLTRVYGDMHVYEESAPANLLDDFSVAQSLDATFGPNRNADGTIYESDTKYTFDKNNKHETASWEKSVTGIDYVTGESVTESGVLVVPSQTYESDRKNEHYFHFTTSIRNRDFFEGNRLDSGETSDRTDPNYYLTTKGDDWDYLNIRVMVTSTNPEVTHVPLKGMYGLGNYANQNPISTGTTVNEASGVPVGQWINLKMDRGYVESQWDKYSIAPYRYNTVPKTGLLGISLTSGWATTKYDQGTYASDPATYSLTKEGAFTLYIDYMSYERDMAISVNGVNGQKFVSSGQDKYPWYVRYDKITTPIGDEVKLGTALGNGTIIYTVTDPDGQTVTLTGENLDTFTPTKKGVYKVKATCDDYVLQKSTTFKFESKQYGELTFEVVDRQVTATLKDANGDNLDLETALMIGTEVGIDVSVQNVQDFNSVGTLVYNVRHLATDSAIEVIDGKFTPLNAGQYSIIVTYTDVHGYVNSSTEIILNTVGKEINVTLTKGGETIDGETVLTMDDVISISATVEGIDEPIASNFIYKVTKIDSVSANNYEYDADEVVGGTFVAGFKGTYEIIVMYNEGEVYHSSEPITISVTTTTLGYFNDFSDSASVYAAYDYNYKRDYSKKNETAEWHASITDVNGETRYGVISTKAGADTGHGDLGINLRSHDYHTTTSWTNAGLTKLVNGIAQDSSSTKYQARMLHNDAWDYIVLPIYIPGEVGGTTYVQTIYGYNAKQVPNNTWYELKLSKLYMAMNFASRSLINQFNDQTTNTPLIFLAPNGSKQEVLDARKDIRVYFDSMYFAKNEEQGDFSLVTMYEQVAGSETITALGIEGQTTFEHYKPETSGGAYTAVASKSYWFEAKIGDKVLKSQDLTITVASEYGDATRVYQVRTEDEEGNVTITAGSKTNFNQVTISKVLKKTTVTDDTLGNSSTSYTFAIKYVDPDTGITYFAYKNICPVAKAVDRPAA